MTTISIEQYACNLYKFPYEEYVDIINHSSRSNKYLIEEDIGKEKTDDFYSVLAFIDGFNACWVLMTNNSLTHKNSYNIKIDEQGKHTLI